MRQISPFAQFSNILRHIFPKLAKHITNLGLSEYADANHEFAEGNFSRGSYKDAPSVILRPACQSGKRRFFARSILSKSRGRPSETGAGFHRP